jgi:hypothetical protein
MMNELIINVLVADALREAEKARLINQEIKPRKDRSQQFSIPAWVDFFLLKFGDISSSKAIQEV